MAPGDDVVMPAELAVGGGSLQQPALQAGAVHGGDGAAARARPHQPLRGLAAEADAADVVRARAARNTHHFLCVRRVLHGQGGITAICGEPDGAAIFRYSVALKGLRPRYPHGAPIPIYSWFLP